MKTNAILAASLLIASSITAQSNFKLSPDSALSIFQTNNPQEKVFVQTDKGSYLAGETIWLKAWCMLDEAPTYLSRILYVDMTDAKGKVQLKKMLRLDSLSSSAGYFEIPANAATGTYSINAYTMWMKNFPEYIFKKNVQVYGPDFEEAKSTAAAKNEVSLRFFPEGGNLIAGITNRVAFKGTDGNNLPIDFTGYIKDNSGKKITDIASAHNGMGVSEFTAEPGSTYTAMVKKSGNTELSFALPKAQPEGISLRVENTNPNKLFIVVNRAEENKARYNNIRIVAQMNYTPVLKATLNIDAGQNALALNKKDLPAGILQITAFDSNDMPLAERIAFIENYTLVKPEVNMAAKSTAARGINRLSFSVPQASQESLSCLVTSYVPGVSADNVWAENIASAFLVTSDLKGYIHKPGYYFKDKTPETLRNLDILLLTQGWRRFDWKAIMINQTAALKYPVESSITLRGQVFKNNSQTPVTSGFTSFIIKAADSTKTLAQADVNSKGEFLLNDVSFMKEANVSYMGTDKTKANNIVQVKLEPNYIDSLKHSAHVPDVNLDTTSFRDQADAFSRSAMEKLSELKAKTLEGVTVKGRKLTPEDKLNEDFASGPFRALPGYLIDPSNQRVGKSIWQMIQERVPGVKLEYNAENPIDPLVSFGRFQSFGEDQGMEGEDVGLEDDRGVGYFLNEIRVPKNVISNLNVEDVAFIKVLKNEGAALGARQGAIALYTKVGGDGGRAVFEKGYETIKMTGFEIARQFYQPEYAYDPAKNTMPDNRYTLYWNGNLSPAANKRYNVQFYNNDVGKKYQLTIQGLNKKGELFFLNQIVE